MPLTLEEIKSSGFQQNPTIEKPKSMTLDQIENMKESDRLKFKNSQQTTMNKLKVASDALEYKAKKYGRTAAHWAANILPEGSESRLQADIDREQKASDEAYAPKEISGVNPVIDFFADPLNAAGGSSKIGQLFYGGLAGALSNKDEPFSGGLIGATGGLAGGLAFDKGLRAVGLAKGFKGTNPDRDMPGISNRRAQQLDEEGISLTPGERTQDSGLLSMEKRQSSKLGTGGVIGRGYEESQADFNENILSRFGVKSRYADESAVNNAHTNVSARLDQFQDASGIAKMDDVAVDKLNDQFVEFPRVKRRLERELNEIAKVKGEDLDMKYITRKASQLRKAARDTTNPEEIQMYSSLADMLHGMAEKQILGADAAASMAHARQLYKELLSLDDAVHVGTGTIAATPFTNSLRNRDKQGYNQSAENPLYETAKSFESLTRKRADDVIGPPGMIRGLVEDAAFWAASPQYMKHGVGVRNTWKNFTGDKSSAEKVAGFLGSVEGRNALLKYQEEQREKNKSKLVQ